MKNILAILILCLIASFASAQTVKTDQAGNYTQVKKETLKTEPKDTGKTFTDLKGNTYPVYESKNGKLFYVRTSAKTGNKYNVYIKP